MEETCEQSGRRLEQEFVDNVVVMFSAYAAGLILFLEWVL